MTRTFRSVRSSILQDLSYENFIHVSLAQNHLQLLLRLARRDELFDTHYWNWVNPIFAFTEMLVALS